jgi:hypothetical protein
VLGRRYGSIKEDVTGEWRILNNLELCVCYILFSDVIISVRAEWTDSVMHKEMK